MSAVHSVSPRLLSFGYFSKLAHKKTQQVTEKVRKHNGCGYFRGLRCFTQTNSGGVNFLSFILSLFYLITICAHFHFLVYMF